MLLILPTVLLLPLLLLKVGREAAVCPGAGVM
jgi:hypothetical protein